MIHGLLCWYYDMTLEERWKRLADALEMAPAVSWALLRNAYTEPHRHYHTLTHIENGLDVLDKLGADLAVKVAFWFHDVVYDAGAPHNEDRSAHLAISVIPTTPICYGMEITEEIARLIRLTKDHKVDWWDKNGSDMVVADLHGLGADWEDYMCNSENVRREYGAFSDQEWVAGRRKFLNHMLVRNIFPPLPQYEALSDQAFSNMSDELNSLRG